MTNSPKTRKVKAWAIVFLGDWIENEGVCTWGDDAESDKMEVFETKAEATYRFKCYANKWLDDTKDLKVIPCTITYQLNPKKSK